MPELPEIELLRRELDREVGDRKVKSVEVPVASVLEVRCRGCGSCVVSCPAGAIRQPGFTTAQLDAEISGALSR